ncbi:hypothetical protein GCM10027610_109650 [Dactylosporangium cerinum]
MHQPSAGEVRLGGRPYRPRRPADALHAGIAVIYQEFNLYPDLTVAENVYSGREPYGRFSRGIRYAEINRRSAELFGILGVHIDPAATVDSLTVSEQQLVEIAKALSVDGRIIVMDEPTAALSADEATRLLDVVRRLRSEDAASSMSATAWTRSSPSPTGSRCCATAGTCAPRRWPTPTRTNWSG